MAKTYCYRCFEAYHTLSTMDPEDGTCTHCGAVDEIQEDDIKEQVRQMLRACTKMALQLGVSTTITTEVKISGFNHTKEGRRSTEAAKDTVSLCRDLKEMESVLKGGPHDDK